MPDEWLRNLLGVVALDIATAMAEEIERATGLLEVEATALVWLHTFAGGRSIEVLRSAVGLSQPGCVRLVDRLAERGLTERRRADGDRRVVTVHLTAEGERVAVAALAARSGVLDRYLDTVADHDRARLEEVLARLSVAGSPGRSGPSANRTCRLCDLAACGYREGTCPVTRFADHQD